MEMPRTDATSIMLSISGSSRRDFFAQRGCEKSAESPKRSDEKVKRWAEYLWKIFEKGEKVGDVDKLSLQKLCKVQRIGRRGLEKPGVAKRKKKRYNSLAIKNKQIVNYLTIIF